jgi:uncharacterized protein YcgI (DUF1989 family)
MSLAAGPDMDAAISLDRTGKMTLPAQPVRGVVVAAPFLGSVRTIPQPINLLMNVGVFPDGRVETGDTPSKPGECVVCKAWVDSVVALSACPQEFHPVADWYPTDLHVGIYEAA